MVTKVEAECSCDHGFKYVNTEHYVTLLFNVSCGQCKTEWTYLLSECKTEWWSYLLKYASSD
jgi:hypothetical protein